MLLPISGVFIDYSRGLLDIGGLFNQISNALFRAPFNAFVNGTLSTIMGILVGVSWGLGAWGIDRLNVAADDNKSRYGSWGLAIALTLAVLLVVAFVPAETLAKIN